MQPKVMINSQYIKDFSLEIPNAPQIFKEINSQPKTSINIAINTEKLEKDFYEVTFKTNINADIEDKKFFIIELSYACVVQTNAKDGILEEVLNIFAPQQIFPFVRSTIVNVMTNSGLAPLMLPPVDFLNIFKQKNKAN